MTKWLLRALLLAGLALAATGAVLFVRPSLHPAGVLLPAALFLVAALPMAAPAFRSAGRPVRRVAAVAAGRGRAAEKWHAIPWRSFWDAGDGGDGGEGPMAAQWGVRAWPTIYVIDDEGVIRHNGLRGDALDAPLERLVEAAEARAA